MDAQASQLVLEWRDRRLVLDGQRSVELGTNADVDLKVECDFTSRHHARLERRNGYYVLIDHSTNGTYVQTEDEQVTFLRRRELKLWGAGWIALGEPLKPTSAIRFLHT